MATNNITPEEQRRLERLRLDETLQPFKTNDDRAKVEVSVAPNAQAGANAAELTRTMDALGLTGNERTMTAALSAALTSNRPPPKALLMTEAKDPFENGSLDYFQVDMTKETLADMIGTEIDPNAVEQRRFAVYPFKTEAMRQSTLKDLAVYCFMKAIQPFTDEEAVAAYVDARDAPTARRYMQTRRNRQMAACSAYMGSVNTAKTLNDQQNSISENVQNSMVRSSNLTKYGKGMICAPILGNVPSAAPDVLRNLNTIISNTPFGSPHNNKSLNEFLNTVAGIINGTYSEKGAYQILKNVLSGEPLKLVQTDIRKEVPFENCWMDLQITYGDYGQSSEGIMNQIKTCLKTRPINVTAGVGRLRNLIEEKNQSKDPGERETITEAETRECVYSYLSIWYPTYLPTIKSKFESINSYASIHNHKTLPASLQLTQLIKEHIRNAAPEPQRSSVEINSLSIGHDYDIIFGENQDQNGIEVYAFQNNYHQGGKKPLNIPDHLRDKCLKCAGQGHLYKHCPKYPGEPLGQTICAYCHGKHSSKCKNLGGIEMNELQNMTTQEDTRGGYYEEPKSQYLWQPGNQQ